MTASHYSHTQNIFDGLVYCYLTDHFFNINLFCQFTHYLQQIGVVQDYAKRLNTIISYFILLTSALQTLPTWNLKNYFWGIYSKQAEKLFSSVIAAKKHPPEDGKLDTSKAFDKFTDIIEKIVTDIYNFSIVYYPLNKILFKEYLQSELCTSDSLIKGQMYIHIRKILEDEASIPLKSYPDFSVDFTNELEFLDPYLLNALTKEFYSVQIPKYFSDYLAPDEYANSDKICDCCVEISNNVTNLIRKKGECYNIKFKTFSLYSVSLKCFTHIMFEDCQTQSLKILNKKNPWNMIIPWAFLVSLHNFTYFLF